MVLVETPLNVAVYEGGTVTLRCTVAEPPPRSRTMWAEYITLPSGVVISDNENLLVHPNRDRYAIIHNTPTEFYLQITDVRLSDGGLYVCMDAYSGPPDNYVGYASIVVIAGPPTCSNTMHPNGVVIEGQQYSIECRTTYQGTYTPTNTWSGPEPFEVHQAHPNPTTVLSGISYGVHRGMTNRYYQCLTNFTNLGVLPDYTASNVPTWEHTYRTPRVLVLWGPKNLTATPTKPVYEVGDIITCVADANPTATYYWQNVRTQQYYNSANYVITEDMRGMNDQLRCHAQNIIQGYIYAANYFINAFVESI
jgi:hypothetical protein